MRLNPFKRCFRKEIITRSGDVDQTPYLERTFLMITPWFRVMWHKFLISDDDCLHDHPWPFLSFIIRRGYYEWCEYDQLSFKEKLKLNFMKIERRTGPKGELQIRRRFRPGSVLYRRADWRHTVQLKDNKPANTLVITFGWQRHWGFWNSKGFVPHEEYTAVSKCD